MRRPVWPGFSIQHVLILYLKCLVRQDLQHILQDGLCNQPYLIFEWPMSGAFRIYTVSHIGVTAVAEGNRKWRNVSETKRLTDWPVQVLGTLACLKMMQFYVVWRKGAHLRGNQDNERTEFSRKIFKRFLFLLSQLGWPFGLSMCKENLIIITESLSNHYNNSYKIWVNQMALDIKR